MALGAISVPIPQTRALRLRDTETRPGSTKGQELGSAPGRLALEAELSTNSGSCCAVLHPRDLEKPRFSSEPQFALICSGIILFNL